MNANGEQERDDSVGHVGKDKDKENRISLCLKEMRVKDNSTIVGSTSKYTTSKES